MVQKREGKEKGREKGEGRKEEEAWGEEKEGRGKEGINLPHGHLKTFAALLKIVILYEHTHISGYRCISSPGEFESGYQYSAVACGERLP